MRHPRVPSQTPCLSFPALSILTLSSPRTQHKTNQKSQILSENLRSAIHQAHLPWMETNRHSSGGNSYCSISKNKKNNTKIGALNVLVCCVALVDSGQVNTTPVYRLSTQLLLPLSPASRVETFLPGLLWISKMAILVHTAVMLIACGGLESEGGGAMSLFACFSEKCRGAQRSRQRSTMTDLRLHVASLAYRCYRF